MPSAACVALRGRKIAHDESIPGNFRVEHFRFWSASLGSKDELADYMEVAESSANDVW